MSPSTAGHQRAERAPGWSGAWPLALAALLRVGVWLTLPASRFASDEASYFQAGRALVTGGGQDLFWPPVTGWLIAGAAWVFQTLDMRWIRLLWIAMDLGCLLAVRTLAARVARRVSGDDVERAARLTMIATVGYAAYLPALSFAQFTTSETPALLQTLLVLVLLSGPRRSWTSFAAAGFLTGTLVLTRPSLLPLLVVLPAAVIVGEGARDRLRHGAVFVLAGGVLIGLIAFRNWRQVGELTIARNSAYNLYIGNRDLYAEDLNLFRPMATAEQIEFRRQYFSGELAYPTQSSNELQRQALTWIATHPGEFARRALGRLARVFAPKTDVLELAGGERAAGIFSPVSLALLGAANVQWALVLFGGIMGLAALSGLHPPLGTLLVGTVLGSLPLCLVAIAKPRYAFVFEPVLLAGAAIVVTGPAAAWRVLSRRSRLAVVLLSAFVLWGWVAWLIFAVSSRLALAGAS